MSEFVEVKAAKLIGPALDWAVQMALWSAGCYVRDDNNVALSEGAIAVSKERQYSTNWTYGGPLLDRFSWAIPCRSSARSHLGRFESRTPGGFPHNGDTLLIAACRAIVASEFVELVSVPASLAEG